MSEVLGMTFTYDELRIVLDWYATSHSTGDPDEDASHDDLAERFKAAARASHSQASADL